MVYAILCALAAVALGALALRHGTWPQALAYLGSVGAVVLAVVCALGRPAPNAVVWPRIHDVALLAQYPVEPQALYLLVKRDGEDVPLLIVLPWSVRKAQQAQDALQQAAAQQTQARWRPGGHPGDGKSGHGQPGNAQGIGDGAGQAGGTGGQGVSPGEMEFYVTHVRPMPPKTSTKEAAE